MFFMRTTILPLLLTSQYCKSILFYVFTTSQDAQPGKLEELLDSELAIVQQGNNEEKLKEHRSYTELLDKIYDRGEC